MMGTPIVVKFSVPFHDNTSTPAAKLYKDERGDTLFCFSEQKMYYPVDVIKNNLIKGTIDTIFQRIWNQCSGDTKDKLMALYEKPVDFIPECWKSNLALLSKFRSGETSIEQHLEILVGSLE